MSLVIVTNHCFLTCEKVNSVILQELESERTKKVKVKGKNKTVRLPSKYSLVIRYVPDGSFSQKRGYGSSSSNGDQEHMIELEVLGSKEAQSLYTQVVKEIQEQSPSQLYLDKLVEKLLNDPNNEVQQATVKARMTDPNADDN